MNMTNEEFYNNILFEEFIVDFENNWLQYATIDERIKTYFGNVENAIYFFKRWKNNEDIWFTRKIALNNGNFINNKN